MTITGQSSLDQEVIDQMVRDAEAHADEDLRRKEEAEIRNNADNLLYQTEKLIADQGEQISDEEKSDLTEKLRILRESLEGQDSDAIRSATEDLLMASQEFGQRLYDAASQDTGMSGVADPATDGGDDEVIDAEIVEEQ